MRRITVGLVAFAALVVPLSGCGTSNRSDGPRPTPLAWLLGGVSVDGRTLIVYSKLPAPDGPCDKPVRARAISETDTTVQLTIERDNAEQSGACTPIGRAKFSPFSIRLQQPIAGRTISGPREASAFPRQLIALGKPRGFVTVPRVVGLTTADAERALCTAALASNAPTSSSMVVTSQDPAGGTKVRRPRSITDDDARTSCERLRLTTRVKLRTR